ncbi:MAG: hypothetical protein GY830_00455 [Bacteroidetes bacterium]|nr:hypothetical protein [Bacteroidota bacterium]
MTTPSNTFNMTPITILTNLNSSKSTSNTNLLAYNDYSSIDTQTRNSISKDNLNFKNNLTINTRILNEKENITHHPLKQIENLDNNSQQITPSALKIILDTPQDSNIIRKGLKNLKLNQFEPSAFNENLKKKIIPNNIEITKHTKKKIIPNNRIKRVNSLSENQSFETDETENKKELTPLPYNPRPNTKDTIVISRNVSRDTVTIQKVPIKNSENKCCCKCYSSSHNINCFCFAFTCQCYTCSKCCGKSYLTADI